MKDAAQEFGKRVHGIDPTPRPVPLWPSVLAVSLWFTPAALADDGGGGTAEAVTFYLVAGAAALAAIGCVVATNIVRMAMCLLGTLGAVALLYFLLAANFLGVIQLIVYAGGTLIVIVFGVMLTSRTYGEKLVARLPGRIAGMLVGLALLSGLVAIVLRAPWKGEGAEAAAFSVGQLGEALLTTYLLPFELASVLLLAVMIGAAYLAQPDAPAASEE